MKTKIVFIVFILFCQSLNGQDNELEIISVYPNQNSNTVTSETEIQIDFNLPLDTTNIIERFIILGDMNGLYQFTIQMDPSLQTIFLNPINNFLIGEQIRVTARKSLVGVSGEHFLGFSWQFTIKPTKTTPPYFSEPKVFNRFSGWYYTTMFPADVNNDGHIDIIILSDPIQIAINDGAGNFSLGQQIPNERENPDIAITDLDLDGFKEIVCTGGIYEADSNGYFEFRQGFNNWVYDVSDMNRDGYPDLIMRNYIGNNGDIIGISYNDGMGHFAGMDTVIVDSIVIDVITGDFNNDGINDIAYGTGVFATPNGTGGINSVVVAFMDSAGDTLYRSVHLSSTPFHILSLDVNNDNFLDVFNSAALSESFFILNDQQGGFIDSAITTAPGSDGYSWSFLGDLTGDGWLDQLYIAEFFTLDGGVCRYNINQDGNFISFWGEDLEIRNNALPFAVTSGDFNGDGSQDVATLWSDGLRIHFNDDEVSIPPTHQNEPKRFMIYQNYPNPFNGETEAQFYLPQAGQIESVIYDINGKEVKKYYSPIYPEGKYIIKWNGKDQNRKEVSSGVYIWRLKFQGFEESIKIILIR